MWQFGPAPAQLLELVQLHIAAWSGMRSRNGLWIHYVLPPPRPGPPSFHSSQTPPPAILPSPHSVQPLPYLSPTPCMDLSAPAGVYEPTNHRRMLWPLHQWICSVGWQKLLCNSHKAASFMAQCYLCQWGKELEFGCMFVMYWKSYPFVWGRQVPLPAPEPGPLQNDVFVDTGGHGEGCRGGNHYTCPRGRDSAGSATVVMSNSEILK